MKSYLVISVLYISTVLVLVLLISVIGIRRVSDISQFSGDRLVPIYSNTPATQSFISNHNGLNTILISLKNRSVTNNKKFEFTLIENNNDIRKISLNGSNIGDGDNVRFQFHPITDSKGKTFIIKLTAPDTNQGEVPIEVSFSNTDTYIHGSSLDPNQEGDFAFQTYYKPQSIYLSIQQMVSRWISLFVNVKTILGIVVVSLLFVLTAKKLGFRYN